MRLLLLLSICWAGLAWADGEVPLSGEEKQLIEQRVAALRTKADIMRQEAEAEFTAASKACWDKFLVSSCQEDAKKTKKDKLEAMRRIEAEAREIDRKLRKRLHAEHEAEMATEGPRREAEAAAQAEKNRRAQQESEERVERKRLEAEQREHR